MAIKDSRGFKGLSRCLAWPYRSHRPKIGNVESEGIEKEQSQIMNKPSQNKNLGSKSPAKAQTWQDGGGEFQTGDILKHFGDLEFASDKEFGLKDYFEMACWAFADGNEPQMCKVQIVSGLHRLPMRPMGNRGAAVSI